MRRGRSVHIGLLQAAIILAALFTAGVHLYLVVTPHPIRANLRQLFLLAAVGYLASLSVMYLPQAFLEPARWPAELGLLTTTVGSIVGYFVVVGFTFSALSLIDKLAEALLAGLIVADMVSEYRSGKQEVHAQEAGIAEMRAA